LTATRSIAATDLRHPPQVIAARIAAFGAMQDVGIAAPREQDIPVVLRQPSRRDPAAGQGYVALRSFMLAGRVDAARRPFPLRSTILRAARRQHARRAAACFAQKNHSKSVLDCRRGANRTNRLHPILGSRRSTAEQFLISLHSSSVGLQ
jgi:hypothetical protein